MVNLVNPSLPMVRPSTKNASTMHWATCCVVLCRFVWMIKCLSFLLLLSWSSSTPFHPKVLQARECVPNSLLFRCFHFRFTFESIKKLGSASLGVLGQNDICMQAPWPSIENTVRGKVVASPKSKLWWVLWICVCPWFVRAPKVLELCTNQLVVWFV